jgi:hypothetical protein
MSAGRPYAGAVLALGLVLWSSGCTPPIGSGHDITSETVREGVLHRTILIDDGPWVVNVLEIDLLNEDLEIRAVHAHDQVFGLETTSAMAERSSDSVWETVAALNADFFHKDGETVNTQITDGLYVRALRPEVDDSGRVLLPRSQFGLTREKKPVLGRFHFEGSVLFPETLHSSLAAVNVIDTRGFVLYNSHRGERTPSDSSRRAVFETGLACLRNNRDTVFYVISGPVGRGGGLPIPVNGAVLTAYQDSLWPPGRSISFGDTVVVLRRMVPDVGELEMLVGGTPRIVLNGENVAGEEGFTERTAHSFMFNRHPRTAVGVSRDSTLLYFLTVDGRQEASAGMTLPEFADLMISIGVYQGLNLDGGGSTTMVVGGHVVNSPSDPTGERPVGNCLLLRAKRHSK